MNKKDLKIVFLGTPEFALSTLELLFKENWNIIGVITAPDKPKGRGLTLSASPVKEFAMKNGMEILQPNNLKDGGFLQKLRSLNADIQIVVAFRMLPEVVWNMPPMGTMNLHASLLPDYRGAAPINWVLMNGEKETGVTTFMLQHEIDTGNILLQEKTKIDKDEDAGLLHDRLKQIGASLVIKSLNGILDQSLTPRPQQLKGNEHMAPKINKQTCAIDWNFPARHIKNQVRGLSPYPTARGLIHGNSYKIYKVDVSGNEDFGKPGQWRTDDKSFVEIQTGEGIINLLEIQKEGKKRMGIREFLIGNKI